VLEPHQASPRTRHPHVFPPLPPPPFQGSPFNAPGLGFSFFFSPAVVSSIRRSTHCPPLLLPALFTRFILLFSTPSHIYRFSCLATGHGASYAIFTCPLSSIGLNLLLLPPSLTPVFHCFAVSLLPGSASFPLAFLLSVVGGAGFSSPRSPPARPSGGPFWHCDWLPSPGQASPSPPPPRPSTSIAAYITACSIFRPHPCPLVFAPFAARFPALFSDNFAASAHLGSRLPMPSPPAPLVPYHILPFTIFLLFPSFPASCALLVWPCFSLRFVRLNWSSWLPFRFCSPSYTSFVLALALLFLALVSLTLLRLSFLRAPLSFSSPAFGSAPAGPSGSLCWWVRCPVDRPFIGLPALFFPPSPPAALPLNFGRPFRFHRPPCPSLNPVCTGRSSLYRSFPPPSFDPVPLPSGPSLPPLPCVAFFPRLVLLSFLGPHPFGLLISSSSAATVHSVFLTPTCHCTCPLSTALSPL